MTLELRYAVHQGNVSLLKKQKPTQKLEAFIEFLSKPLLANNIKTTNLHWGPYVWFLVSARKFGVEH